MPFGSLFTTLCFMDSIHAQFHTHQTGQTFQLVLYQPLRDGGEGRNRTDEYSFCRAVPYHLATPPSFTPIQVYVASGSTQVPFFYASALPMACIPSDLGLAIGPLA